MSHFFWLMIFISFVLPLFCCALVLAGFSFGIRKKYIKLLLQIFEYVTKTTRKQIIKDKKHAGQVATEKDHDGFLDSNSSNTGESNSFTEGEFHWEDVSCFVKSGLEAIIEDEVTKRFDAEELETWNLLTRTNSYQHINVKLTLLWGIGFVIRYFILFPVRFLFASGVIIMQMLGTILIGLISNMKIKQALNRFLFINTFRLFIRAFSGTITYHNKENLPRRDGICVANHTTPIDVIVLGCDNAYAMVGQKQGGFVGLMERAWSRAESHIWFERSETRDRLAVSKKLREHVEDPRKLPILIFPEGTCINNTSVMMFKKGCFEIGAIIYPVAIKYDSRFADCFWNSSKYGMVRYLLMMMSSWALVADVWYLPPMKQKENEDAIDFANRVKKVIAKQGGLVDLQWDGGLKRDMPKMSMKLAQQKNFSDHLLTKNE